jgi:ABC-type multidrug transport system fused ATPase/permease subunit
VVGSSSVVDGKYCCSMSDTWFCLVRCCVLGGDTALLVNPRILLLDEATSALDAESEHLVQEAIDNAVAGRTVVIIAHRLSTIRNAQQIVVVDNHQVVAVGSHEVLLEQCPKYQELISRQSFIQDTS